jgi:serine/threonine protein kinase
MSDMSQPKACPKCGGAIPAEAPQGLCPKCLLLQASLGTEAGQGASAKAAAPPSPEELAAAFPELEILELAGQGGMGFVYKARQPKLERLVALKILPQSLAADPTFAERFTREARMLARLNHPNIVTIHDFGQARGLFYVLMEFVDGVNLRQAMSVGRFTPQHALAVVPRICDALQFAHNEGILHRDIKPENILLDPKGRVKIADFGIAKLIAMGAQVLASAPSSGGGKDRPPGPAALTETGKTLGTPHYMAPEQLEHPEDVDQRADIYSLGVVFYEMLTGELPLGRFAPPSEKSAVDARVDEVVLRALQKEREYRQKSAGEVRTQVETITSTASGPAAGLAGLPTPPTRPDRFWRRFAIMLLALVIPAGMVAIGFMYARARVAREAARRAWEEAANVATVATSAKFVLSPTQVSFRPHGPEQMDWALDLFVPANNLASILFVRWDNDVPTIIPGLSAYFKVGPAGGVDIRYCSFSCEPIPQSQILAMTNAEGRQALAQWGIASTEANQQTNVVQWNVNFGLGFTSSRWLATPAYHRTEMALPQTVRSGYQRAVRMVYFQTPEQDKSRHGQSGIELRILVEPLLSRSIKTVPYEIEGTNYIAGEGLARTMEHALQSMKRLPIEP